jgi:pSer/pThr/pTyr-binding forkhead associated (FHA) protein
MIRELYFVIRYEGKLERIHRVDVPETTIGRIQSNVLCLPDPVVSRTHAVLIQTPTEFVIRDLRSRNGTLLNGQPIVEAVLGASSVVEIGPYQLKAFSDLDSAQADVGDVEESTRKQPILVLSRHEQEEREKQLTPAQRRVYDVFLQGRSEKEIAQMLRISINTVHTHARAIYTEFDVSSRAELLALCAGHLTQHD